MRRSIASLLTCLIVITATATMAQDIGAKPEIANKVEKHYYPLPSEDMMRSAWHEIIDAAERHN